MSAVPAPASRRIHVASLTGLRTPGGALLWQGDQLATPALPACPSGHAALDAQLPGGGWPASGLTELLLPEPGCGEIRLLAPALRQLATDGRELVWIAPPLQPYAPALQALGVQIERLILLLPADEADAAWAAEQTLRSAGAAAVLWWSRSALPATLRRLHLAAQEGGTPLFAFRPADCRIQSSPAPLRLALAPAAAGQLRIDLFKRRGPSLAQPLLLALPHPARDGRGRPAATPPAGPRVGAAPAAAPALPALAPVDGDAAADLPLPDDALAGPAPALAAA